MAYHRRNKIDNTDKQIDSRDAVRQFEDMESERQDLVDALEEVKDEKAGDTYAMREEELKDWDRDNGDEYRALKAFCDEGDQNAADWGRGAVCIHESAFTDYMKDWAVESGTIERSQLHVWPFDAIDWDAAADSQKPDFAEIDFDGETYLVRC